MAMLAAVQYTASLNSAGVRQRKCSATSSSLPYSTVISSKSSAIPREFGLRLSSHMCVRHEISSSMSSSSEKRTTMAALQGSSAVTEQNTEESRPSSTSALTMIYLEGNSWLWEIVGLKILVDPVLVGNLDFGIPFLYDAGKKVCKDFKLEDLPDLDCILITQGYDDHCHANTLEPLSRLMPNVRVIASPNAEPILNKFFKNVTYLEPKTGESMRLRARNGSEVVVRASPGPILGPPWQRPENGYFIEVNEPKFTIYYEPHCVFENANLQQKRADVLVTPVIEQVLPGYKLVAGQEDAVKVAEYLQAKFVVTMKNGDLEAKGLLSMIVRENGTTEGFQELLAKKFPNVKVLNPEPGVPLKVAIDDSEEIPVVESM